MNIKPILLIAGIATIVLKRLGFIVINNWWIVLCFALWFALVYLSVHRKNKERNTPKPVYLTNQPN